VVVDNGSTDDSAEIISNFQFPNSSPSGKTLRARGNIQFRLIQNETNLGFTGGNNVGIKYALKNNADYILVLNNDTLVDESLLNEFLKVFKAYPKAGAISPKIYFAKGFEFHKKKYKKSDLGKVVWAAGGEIDWENVYGTNRGVNEVDKGQYDKPEEVDFASGACVFYRAIALRKVGMFDEKYFMYLEDVDLSMRMKIKSWRVLYAPKAIIWHKVAQSTAIGSDLNDYYITRNRLRFGMMYAPFRSKLALLKESWKFLLKGRFWQKIAVKDFYLGIGGRGSFR
jgi:GT2 family glycosyltransferase